MGLIAQAKADIEQITSDQDGFGLEITFTAPNLQTATVTGLHTKIHLGVNPEGEIVNTKKAYISVSEKFLIDQNYPVRTNGEVKLKNHKVNVKDSTGVVKNYVIKEWFPDETIGLITCLLESFS